MIETITTYSEDDTADAGRKLAAGLTPGTAILLFGDLGAGKTAFVRGLAAGLGVAPGDVTSPTFTLVQEYRHGRIPLLHVDLYRLNDPREVDDLGLEELGEEAVLAIEWAEKLARRPPNTVIVRIRHGAGDERQITVETVGEGPYSER